MRKRGGTNGHLSIEFYLATVISLFICSLFIMYFLHFFVSLSNVSRFFSFILFLCLACIFCVPFVYLSNVCSFSLLFSYVIVLARLSQVFITY